MAKGTTSQRGGEDAGSTWLRYLQLFGSTLACQRKESIRRVKRGIWDQKYHTPPAARSMHRKVVNDADHVQELKYAAYAINRSIYAQQ
jgi:hypothetical protein